MTLKVALVLFGQPRNLKRPIVSLSHKFLLRGTTYRIFGHTWFSPTSTTVTSARLGNLTIQENSIELIKSRYPGIRLMVEAPLENPLDLIQGESLESVKDQRLLSNILSQLRSIHGALQQLSESEERFDLVVLTRWDVMIWKHPHLKSLPLDRLTVAISNGVANQMKYGIPDQLIVGPPELVKATDPFPEIIEQFRNCFDNAAEFWKFKAFLRAHGVHHLNYVRSFVAIVRSNSYFDICVRRPMIELKNRIRIRIRIKNLLRRMRLV